MMYFIWVYYKMYDVNMIVNGIFMVYIVKGVVVYIFIDYNMMKINDNYRLYWKYD